MTKVPSWRKSSFSAEQTDCVEVNGTLTGVRDSKFPTAVVSIDVRVFVRALRQLDR